VAVKQREVPSEVQAVLKSAKVEGGVLKLPGQMDRKLYVRTDEVLRAFGFQWNKKAGGHVNAIADATKTLEEMRGGGTFSKQSDYGFFPTPEPVLDLMFAGLCLKITDQVLEPSAGNGNIAMRARSHVYTNNVFCIELQEPYCALLRQKGFLNVLCCDFLTYAVGPKGPAFDAVLMNPPFANQQDIDHVTHAIKHLKPGGKLRAIMAGGLEFRSNKKTEHFLDLLNASGVFNIHTLPEGSFKESGTQVNTVLVSLDKTPLKTKGKK